MSTTDPLWYKDAIIYELHVRAFHDSTGEGVGDFRGLTQKLDYLVDLGVTAVWLLPFYPSPLKDDGYDIADYASVHPRYGRIEDFRQFLKEAKRRGIRVITELVINHTSDQHHWFQRARLSPPGSPERDFYVWSDTAERYKQARIIFKDFEPSNWSWDPVAKAYYWHRFYSHQPDLNYDNPAVWKAIFPLVDFWFGMGVDGMRLDAVPYLFEREGTNCENLPETHEFLRALRKHVDERYAGRMFLAEANQWPEDAVAYFGQGDECHMAFHFPLMPRLFMALHQEDRFPIMDILAQTPPLPDQCQWCLFLRNHDELTLEMVTDEERDYMYRAYALERHARINLGIRRRLAPLLRNDRGRIALMNALLFSLPGTPVIYYGDEIGMGDNIYLGDRNGVRTPMQWSSDRNAGFSRANSQKLYLPVIIDAEYHYEAVNVEAQQNNPSSLLWWMKRLIALRKRFKAFSRGTIEYLRPSNPKIFAFIRRYQNERVLVVANLSRFVQYVELDIRDFAGLVPIELFGRSQLPTIGEQPYLLTLGAHNFYWFSLETPALPSQGVSSESPGAADIPEVAADVGWLDLIQDPNPVFLESLLATHLRRRQLFSGDARILATRLLEVLPFGSGEETVWMLIVRVEFQSNLPVTMALSFGLAREERAEHLLAPLGMVGLVRVRGAQPGIVCDALALPEACAAIVAAIAEGRTSQAGDTELQAVPLPGIGERAGLAQIPPPSVLQQSEHGNLTVRFGEQFMLKRFRRLEEGISPTLEIGRYLTESSFAGIAPVLGYVEYRRRGLEPSTLAVLYQFVPNHGDGWHYTLDQISSFFERVAAAFKDRPPPPSAQGTNLHADEHELGVWSDLIGGYLQTVRDLGKRTAEMHLALANNSSNPSFAAEPFGRMYQRSLYQSMRNLAGHLFSRLERVKRFLAEPTRVLAERLLDLNGTLIAKFQTVLDLPTDGQRIRVHGDYHLGNLLYTGKEFIIIDFEGQANQTIEERRIKRAPLRDVASMIRSFDYAVMSALAGVSGGKGELPGIIRPEDRLALWPWANGWSEQVSRSFAAAYFTHIQPGRLVQVPESACVKLLDLFLLEQALQEIDFELTHRPQWAAIPLEGALRLLGHDPHRPEVSL